MFPPPRDRYRQLHHRRRRPRSVFVILSATLLVGCAAAAAIYERDPAEHPAGAALGTSDATPTDSDGGVVAHLTAHDAVTNALRIATPAVDPVDEARTPRDWSDGLAVRLQGELQKNESISIALTRRSVPAASAHTAITALAQVVNFRRSKPGDPWEVDVDADGVVKRLRVATSPVDIWEARREDGRYTPHQIDVPTEQRVEVVTGVIDASLWQAFESGGADGRLAAAFADIFAYTIDFATETQRGDRFAVAFESTWLDGERLATGKIVGARYLGAAGDHFAFRWNDGYYDAAGESVERQFLRSPLATVRITSNYGRRFHPVLGRMKMHAGVDYGAPTGTPVQAVADGTVTFAGWKGANGKLVAIRHAGGFTTYYAHLSHIDAGLRAGTRVKKKRVIGKVGSTGRSTGPHLHFGMKRHGSYINPLEVDFERGAPLERGERQKFLAATAKMRAQLDP